MAFNTSYSVVNPIAHKCASFDGVDDQIVLLSNPLEHNFLTISLNCFYKYSSSEADRTFIEVTKSSSISNNIGLWFYTKDVDKRVSVGVCDGSSREYLSWLNQSEDSVWNNFILTINRSTKKYNLYKNGVLVSEETSTKTLTFLTSDDFRIGKIGSTAFNGCFSNVRIWNKVLDPTEIAKVAAGDNSVARENLVGEWKLADNYNDTSGNGNNGTNSGSVLTSVEAGDLKDFLEGTYTGTTDKVFMVECNKQLLCEVMNET